MSSKKQWKKAYKLLEKETNMLYKEIQSAGAEITFLQFKLEEATTKRWWQFWKSKTKTR